MKMITYNEMTDSEDLGIVSPTPHPTTEEPEAQRKQWRETLQEGLLTLPAGLFHPSALPLST